jgi:chorismate mutase
LIRGVRGATTVEHNERTEILNATECLLKEIVSVNQIDSEDIASVIFSVTPDLDAEYPALSARERLGWQQVPLLDTINLQTPNGLGRCIRVLIHWNTSLKQAKIQHIYQNKATYLRPDLNDCADYGY